MWGARTAPSGLICLCNFENNFKPVYIKKRDLGHALPFNTNRKAYKLIARDLKGQVKKVQGQIGQYFNMMFCIRKK